MTAITPERRARVSDLLTTRFFIRNLMNNVEPKKVELALQGIPGGSNNSIQQMFEEEYNYKYSPYVPENKLKWRQSGDAEWLPMPVADMSIVRVEGQQYNHDAPTTPPPIDARWRKKGRYALHGRIVKRLKL